MTEMVIRNSTEYDELAQKIWEYSNKYTTSFGAPIVFVEDKILISDSSLSLNRELTIPEMRELVRRYEQLREFIMELSKNPITYESPIIA